MAYVPSALNVCPADAARAEAVAEAEAAPKAEVKVEAAPEPEVVEAAPAPKVAKVDDYDSIDDALDNLDFDD